MVKIIYRPEPPPDVDSNRAVRKSDTFLNREASAGLFNQALAKAQGQKQAVEHTQLTESREQQQLESDTVLGAKARENRQVLHDDIDVDVRNAVDKSAEHAAVESSEMAEKTQELTSDEIEVDDADQQDESELSSSEPQSTLDSSAVYSMFENLRDSNHSAESNQQTDTGAASESVNDEPDVNTTAQAGVAHSASATASMENRIDSMSTLSDLIDMLEESDRLPVGNEWTLILEDDGPVSELTLSSDAEGKWNIDLLTAFDNEAVDDQMISSLRQQLDTAGIAVGNIALLDSATLDSTRIDSKSTNSTHVESTQAESTPAAESSTQPTSAMDSGNSNAV